MTNLTHIAGKTPETVVRVHSLTDGGPEVLLIELRAEGDSNAGAGCSTACAGGPNSAAGADCSGAGAPPEVVSGADDSDPAYIVGTAGTAGSGSENSDKALLPEWTAGSHIDLLLGPLTRQYSLLGDPTDRTRWLIAVRREEFSRGGSACIHDQLRVGHTLTAVGPRNSFPLDCSSYLDYTGAETATLDADGAAAGTRGSSFSGANTGSSVQGENAGALEPSATTPSLTPSSSSLTSLAPPPVLLLAGGIGITPLLSMAETLSASHDPFELHVYSSGEPPLAEYAATRPWVSQLTTHDTTAHPEESLRAAATLPMAYTPGSQVYICGPAGFIDRARDLALAAGWPTADIHVEHFVPAEPLDISGADFTVIAQSTGEKMQVKDGETIASALLEHGYPVELSCEMGICGSCLTGVIAGTPDHRDEVQSEAEHASNRMINVCCSRSLSPTLTLDV